MGAQGVQVWPEIAIVSFRSLWWLPRASVTLDRPEPRDRPMRRAILLLAVFGVPGLVAAPVPPKKGNLLVNGSFEEGPAITDFLPLDPGSEAIKGWVVTRGQIDLV